MYCYLIYSGNPLSPSVEAQLDGWLQGFGIENLIIDNDNSQHDDNNDVLLLHRNPDLSEQQLENMTNITVYNSYQNAVLQKEGAILRQQCVKLQVSYMSMLLFIT